MENKNIYTDNVERIVNDPKRQNEIAEAWRKRRAMRQRRILTSAISYAALSFVFAFFGLVGWVIPCVAFPVCATGGLCSAFRFGRLFEHGKTFGWM